MGISISINQSLCASLCGTTANAFLNCSNSSNAGTVICATEENQIAHYEQTADISIRTLLPYDMTQLHRCICDGFSTETHKIEISRNEVELKLRQNGYCPELSLGAFHEGAMMGFWLSALRTIGLPTTGFCSGTSVLKGWRGNGIATTMSSIAIELARRMGITEYRLIVDSRNVMAQRLYRRLGFEVSRTFSSYRAQKILLPFEPLKFTTEEVSVKRALEAGATISRFEPNWYSLDEGIETTSPSHVAAIAKDKSGHESAYVIFQPGTGRVVRLEVERMDVNLENAALQGMIAFVSQRAETDRTPEIFLMDERVSNAAAHLHLFGFALLNLQHEMSMEV